MLFSNTNYAESIEIKTYLMNNIHVSKVFQQGSEEIIQPPFNEIDMKKLYLVVMMKNNGNKAAWGKLKCSVSQRELAIINVPVIGPNMNDFAIFTVPVHGIRIPRSSDKPMLNVAWKKLNAK